MVGQQELVEVSGVGELWARVSDEPEGGPGRVDGDAGVADLMRGSEGWRPVEEVSRVVPVVVVPQLDVKTFYLKICSAAETLSGSRVVAVREVFTGRRFVVCREVQI